MNSAKTCTEWRYSYCHFYLQSQVATRGQLDTPAALYYIEYKDAWAPETLWTLWKREGRCGRFGKERNLLLSLGIEQ